MEKPVASTIIRLLHLETFDNIFAILWKYLKILEILKVKELGSSELKRDKVYPVVDSLLFC